MVINESHKSFVFQRIGIVYFLGWFFFLSNFAENEQQAWPKQIFSPKLVSHVQKKSDNIK